MTATAHEPTARHSKRRHGAPRAGLLAFLALALLAAGAGFVVRTQAEHPRATAAPWLAVEPAAYFLTAEATAEVRTARFRISTTRAPASAVLAVDPAGKSPARRVPVELATASTEVVLRGLAVGRASWTITAPGAPTLRGHLRILATGATPEPTSATPLPSGSPSVVFAPSTSTPVQDPARPSWATPTAATPTATPTPTPTPPTTPTPTPTPTPSLTPTPTPLPTPKMRVSTGSSQILAGTRTRPQLAISGLPAGYRGSATLRLYGPTTQPSGLTCQSTQEVHAQSILVTANGTYTGADVRLDRAGYYGWSVVLPGSATSAPAYSGCAPAGAIVQVTQW